MPGAATSDAKQLGNHADTSDIDIDEVIAKHHSMIERKNMFTRLLEVCPAFRPTWEEFIVEWEGHEDDLPYYLLLGDLARHLIAMLERGETERIRMAFQVVEEWHLEGEHYVKEAATIGLLEDLQNTGLHNDETSPEDFVEFLLPETRFWWFKVVDLWENGKLIIDDRPKH